MCFTYRNQYHIHPFKTKKTNKWLIKINVSLFWWKMFSKKNSMYVLVFGTYNETISCKKTLLWSTKKKLNIMENIFQTLHIQQTITIVLHTKKIFLSHFQSDIKTKENQYVFKKKKKSKNKSFLWKIYIFIIKTNRV